MDPEDARFKKRSVTLMGHKTSVALEKAFWRVLEESAREQDVSLNHLIQEIDSSRTGSLSSALRLYALLHAPFKHPACKG